MAGGRKRAIIKSVLVAFVVIAAWIGALVWWQSRKGESYSFRKETQAVMEMIRDGKAAELYEQASPHLQNRMIETRFIEKATQVNQTLGSFRRILSTHDQGITDEPTARTGYVEASLEFERASTTVTLGFEWDPAASRWRLLSFHYDIPKDLRGQVPAPELVKPPREAPSKVVELTREMLEDIRDGKATEVYARAHKDFKKAIDLERFLELIRKREREMGTYKQIIDFTKTGKNDRGLEKHAWVTAVIEYTRATTTGTFDFIDDDGEGWRLSKFKIDIPAPVVPVRPLPGATGPS